MNRLGLCILSLMLLVGCSSPAPQPQTTSGAATAQPKPKPNPVLPPNWVLNPPNEPGMAFYGVGAATYKNNTQLNRALQNAATSARRQLADTMKTKVQGATKSYARQILTAEGDIAEESLSQDVTRAVTNFALSGATVVKTDLFQDPDTGLTTVFCLARIGFDSVAESMHNETARRIEQVRRNAEEAFDELDDLLEAEQKKDNPEYIPPPPNE